MDENFEIYVRQAAALQGLTLDAETVRRVALVLGRNALMARQVMAFELEETQEIAPVFEARS